MGAAPMKISEQLGKDLEELSNQINCQVQKITAVSIRATNFSCRERRGQASVEFWSDETDGAAAAASPDEHRAAAALQARYRRFHQRKLWKHLQSLEAQAAAMVAAQSTGSRKGSFLSSRSLRFSSSRSSSLEGSSERSSSLFSLGALLKNQSFLEKLSAFAAPPVSSSKTARRGDHEQQSSLERREQRHLASSILRRQGDRRNSVAWKEVWGYYKEKCSDSRRATERSSPPRGQSSQSTCNEASLSFHKAVGAEGSTSRGQLATMRADSSVSIAEESSGRGVLGIESSSSPRGQLAMMRTGSADCAVEESSESRVIGSAAGAVGDARCGTRQDATQSIVSPKLERARASRDATTRLSSSLGRAPSDPVHSPSLPSHLPTAAPKDSAMSWLSASMAGDTEGASSVNSV